MSILRFVWAFFRESEVVRLLKTTRGVSQKDGERAERVLLTLEVITDSFTFNDAKCARATSSSSDLGRT